MNKCAAFVIRVPPEKRQKKKPNPNTYFVVRFRFGLVEVTGLAHQRLLTQSNRVQCDLGHRHGIAVGGIATFEPVPDNKKIRPDGRKDFGGSNRTRPSAIADAVQSRAV